MRHRPHARSVDPYDLAGKVERVHKSVRKGEAEGENPACLLRAAAMLREQADVLHQLASAASLVISMRKESVRALDNALEGLVLAAGHARALVPPAISTSPRASGT